MKYLLDTHVFLWLLFEDESLSKKALNAIINPGNDIYVSVITYWEISLKYSIGKLNLRGISPAELPAVASEVGIATLNVTAREAASFHELPRIKHKDPFDRFIVWQAVSQGLVLISKDQAIGGYGKHGLTILW